MRFSLVSPRVKVRFLLAAIVLMLIGIADSARAQVVAIQGGTSTLLGTSGAQADYHWGPYSGFFSAGYSNGLQFGGLVSTQWKGYDLRVGDTQQNFALDTDILNPGQTSFYARGIQLSRKSKDRDWSAFFGKSATQYFGGFYNSYAPDALTGSFTFHQKLSSRLDFHSSTIIQDKFTTLASLNYKLSEHWVVATSGGVGRNAPYYSLGTELTRERYQVTASYTFAGQGFQRFKLVNAGISEHSGLNFKASFQPNQRWGFYVSHDEMMPITDERVSVYTGQKVSMNGVGVNTFIAGFRINANATNSTSGTFWTNSRNVMVQRNLFNRFLSMTGTVTQLNNQYGKNRFYVGTAEEHISPRLSISQSYTRSGGQNSFSVGGNIRTNRITVGIQQQMVYNTMAGSTRSAFHAWAITLRLPLFRGIHVNANTYVDPTNRVRYTGFLDGIFFARNGETMPGRGQSPESVSFAKYIVKGIVLDEEDKPVWGIAVQIDGHTTVYSDNTGQFYVRFAKRGDYPVMVHLDQSLSPFAYKLISAPGMAHADTDNLSKQIVIHVTRVIAISAHKTPAPNIASAKQ